MSSEDKTKLRNSTSHAGVEKCEWLTKAAHTDWTRQVPPETTLVLTDAALRPYV